MFIYKISNILKGAILSTYQKNRVENVCKRLSLISLAYLWERDQLELLDEMITSDIHAVLIKIACIGRINNFTPQTVSYYLKIKRVES